MYGVVRSARMYKIESEAGSTTSRGSGGSAPLAGSRGSAPSGVQGAEPLAGVPLMTNILENSISLG